MTGGGPSNEVISGSPGEQGKTRLHINKVEYMLIILLVQDMSRTCHNGVGLLLFRSHNELFFYSELVILR